jgi:hypothetical protein
MINIDKDEIGIIATVIAFFTSCGAFIHRVQIQSKKIVELQEAVKAIPLDIKNRLYDDKSQPIYVPEEICAKRHNDFDKKFNRLEDKIDKLIEMHLKNYRD